MKSICEVCCSSRAAVRPTPIVFSLFVLSSALDPDSQDKLMKLVTEEREATTIVSVGHRPELEQFHSRKITLERRRGGAKLVNDIELVRKPGRSLLWRWKSA